MNREQGNKWIKKVRQFTTSIEFDNESNEIQSLWNNHNDLMNKSSRNSGERYHLNKRNLYGKMQVFIKQEREGKGL